MKVFHFILLAACFILPDMLSAASLEKYSIPVPNSAAISTQRQKQSEPQNRTRSEMIDLKLIRSLEILRSQTPEVQQQWIEVYRRKLTEARNQNNTAAVEYYERLIKLASQ